MEKPKVYDLEDRTYLFAKSVSVYVRNLPKDVVNIEQGKQLVRSSGSIGANYIEANESLSRKDFLMRLKISRKEAKETHYWIRLTEPRAEFISDKEALLKESLEIKKILSAIIEKTVL